MTVSAFEHYPGALVRQQLIDAGQLKPNPLGDVVLTRFRNHLHLPVLRIRTGTGITIPRPPKPPPHEE